VWYLQDENYTWEDGIFDGSGAANKVFLFFFKINKYF